MSLKEIIELALDEFQTQCAPTVLAGEFGVPGVSQAQQTFANEWSARARRVPEFLVERLRYHLESVHGFRYDTVRAALAPRWDPPLDALRRAQALERVRDSEDFVALAAAAKRTRNIRKSADAADILEGQADPALFAENPERELYAAYRSLSQRIERLSERGEFEEAFRTMATIRPPVDRFFDKVLVMTDDVALRRNRLRLLMRLNEDVFTSLADLAEIVVEARSAGGGQK
jgi:glycyl-tRNA synthetase beta chain